MIYPLNAVSPLAVLGRGYSITFRNGVALRSVADIAVGDPLTTRLQDGEVETQVTALKKAGSAPEG